MSTGDVTVKCPLTLLVVTVDVVVDVDVMRSEGVGRLLAPTNPTHYLSKVKAAEEGEEERKGNEQRKQ